MIYAGKSIQVVGLDDHIAELSFNAQGAPVNVFSVDVVAELSAALDALEADFTRKGLIVTSAKQVFIAGADITEFLTLFQSGAAAIKSGTVNNNRNYNRLEELTMPVVAAINGAALGGGFELCLSCDYRIASFNALIGLPECSPGIIPGWGGTVRLPRIAGFETAVEWIAFAQHQNAGTGLKAGGWTAKLLSAFPWMGRFASDFSGSLIIAGLPMQCFTPWREPRHCAIARS